MCSAGYGSLYLGTIVSIFQVRQNAVRALGTFSRPLPPEAVPEQVLAAVMKALADNITHGSVKVSVREMALSHQPFCWSGLRIFVPLAP